jgi:hypothetical protein
LLPEDLNLLLEVFHWQTMTLRSVTFGVFFPKETRCES